MAINYTLSIGNVTKKFTVGEFNNVIVDVSVGVSASSTAETDADGNVIVPSFSYSCGGTISLDTSELSAESFVDFDSVTKDTVIEWLLAKEGVETVDEFSYVKSSVDNIQGRIDALQEEVSVSTGWTVTNAPAEDPEVLEA
jgi:hypothetical protein